MNNDQNNLNSNNFDIQGNNQIFDNQRLQNDQSLNNDFRSQQLVSANGNTYQQSTDYMNEELEANADITQQPINNKLQSALNYLQLQNQMNTQQTMENSMDSFGKIKSNAQNLNSIPSKKKTNLILGIFGIFVVISIILFVCIINNDSSKKELNNNNVLEEQIFIDKDRLTKKEYSIENVGENFSINVTAFRTTEDGREEEVKKVFSFKESENIKFSNYNIIGDFFMDVVNKNNKKLFSINVILEKNASFDYYKESLSSDVDYGHTIVETTNDSLSFYNVNSSNYKHYYYMRDIDGKVFSFEYTNFGNGIQFTDEQIYDYLRQASNCIIPDDNSPFLIDKIMLIPLVLNKRIVSNEYFYSVSKDGISLNKDIGDIWEKEESYGLEIKFKQNDNVKDKVSSNTNISRYENYSGIYSYEIIEDNIINVFTPTHSLIDKKYGVDTVEGMYEIMNMFLINMEV